MSKKGTDSRRVPSRRLGDSFRELKTEETNERIDFSHWDVCRTINSYNRLRGLLISCENDCIVVKKWTTYTILGAVAHR